MKATLDGHTIADSDDIVMAADYAYFPPDSVHTEWLEKAPKTAADHACPHGVQFYDVLLDGTRYGRAAWSYESPRPTMQAVAHRFGFWNEVQVA